MKLSPREKAEACFAVARSATIAGERDAAIGRGMAVCERYRLDLDSFDIPGRPRSVPRPPPSRYARDLFSYGEAPKQYTAEDVADLMERFRAHMGGLR